MHYLRNSAHKAPQANFFLGFGCRPYLQVNTQQPGPQGAVGDFFLVFGCRSYHFAFSQDLSPQGAAGDFFLFLDVGPTIARLVSDPAKMAPQAKFFFGF